MAESYMWVFRCPMCGQREPKWKEKKLSCKLNGMPPDNWFSEVGVGEVVLVSRGFFNVGSTSVVPGVVVNYVKAYLSEHHNAMLEDIKRSVGLEDTLPEMFSDNGDFIVFEDPDTGEYRIMSRSQARIIHQLKEQQKFADLAKKKRSKVMNKIYSRRKPAEKYKNAWNRHYIAKGAMEIGNKVGLLDKRDNVILESIVDGELLKRETNRLRQSAYQRSSIFET